jgi:hypothetical protein
MVSLKFGVRERIAVLTLAALILGGGVYPQPGVSSRYRAAEEILRGHEDWYTQESGPNERWLADARSPAAPR